MSHVQYKVHTVEIMGDLMRAFSLLKLMKSSRHYCCTCNTLKKYNKLTFNVGKKRKENRCFIKQ